MKSTTCIFCMESSDAKSVEHIVSESLGNDFYIMPIGSVCDSCNAKFSKFEGKALTNTVFLMERANMGVITKKRKNVKGRIENIHIQGDPQFKKNHVFIEGLQKEDILKFDQNTKELQIKIKSFDKSEEAAAKLVLKMALEALFKSQKKNIFDKYNFDELRAYVLGKNNKPWPFALTNYEPKKFSSIPKYQDKYELKRRGIQLQISELNSEVLLFRFNYNGIQMVINLLNRSSAWLDEFIANDQLIQINPENFKKATEN